jgi:flagellar basal-body rod protein FlgF
MTDAEVRGASMKQGEMTQTGNPLDVAFNGDTMMAVQARDGTEAYTRRGDLTADANGMLVNGDNAPVLGKADHGSARLKLTISRRDRPRQRPGQSGPAAQCGRPDQAGLLYRIADRKRSRRPVRVVGGGALPADENAKLVSGALEKSNVDPTSVLVEMVEAQRLFDMRTKVVSTARENDEKSTCS